MIARDQAELDDRNIFVDQLDAMPWELDDAMLPNMPQGEPGEQPHEPQNGPGAEDARRDETNEPKEDPDERGARCVEQLLADFLSSVLCKTLGGTLTRARKRKSAPSSSPEHRPAFRRDRQAGRCTNTGLPSTKGKAPRQGRKRHPRREDTMNADAEDFESKSPVRESRFWPQGERATPAAGLKHWARQFHERISPQGWSAYQAQTEGQHQRTGEVREVNGAVPPMSHCRARVSTFQGQQPMRAHPQQRSYTHHQQHDNEHRQRNETTQQPGRQGQRNANEGANNHAETEQVYMSQSQHGRIPQAGRESVPASIRQEQARDASRYSAMMNSNASQLPGDSIGRPAHGSRLPGNPRFESTPGHRIRRPVQEEGYLRRNSRNARRFHENGISPIPEEFGRAPIDSGARRSGGRRGGRQGGQDRPPRLPDSGRSRRAN